MLPALRVAAVVNALALFLQPVLAGMFLSGQDSAIDLHATTATVVVALGLVLAVLGFLAWRRRLVGRAVFTVSVALLVVEVLQTAIGYAHLMWLHVPLGVLLFGGMVQLMPQVLRAGRSATANASVAVSASASAAASVSASELAAEPVPAEVAE
jgi:hypothetical protein